MKDPMGGMFQGLDVIASGLRAELQRSEVVAANLGNMHRTGNAEREPYRRKAVVFEEVLERMVGLQSVPGGERVAAGVEVTRVVEDRVTPFPRIHDPGHPDADAQGFVWTSNVDLFQELVDMAVIERSFQANLQAMRAYRGMLQSTITNIGRS